MFSTTLLAALRMTVGGATLLFPMQCSALFGVPMAPENKIMARLFGVRDLVLGVLLWTARNHSSTSSITSANGAEDGFLRRTLWAGLTVDVIDVCSCAWGELDGTVSNRAVLGVGAGAASFAGLGLLGLLN